MRLPWLLLCLCLLGAGVSAAPGDTRGGTLHYRVSYQGILSAGSRVNIADVTLRTREPAPDAGYHEAALTVSSAPYAYVERFYPIRYRFRSWYWSDRSGVLASEYYEYGRPDDIDHKLIYLDDRSRPFVTHTLGRADSPELSDLAEGRYHAASARGERHAFDRLGLLQAVRGMPLGIGQVHEFRVSNGSEMLRYRVKVEKRVRVRAAGRAWDSLKLRFEGLRTDRHGNERHAHRPVYIWVSDDARHIPLLAESRHALGRFRVSLTSTGVKSTRVALRSTE
jgi:hypothetical protein